jgi:hypothetical protein
MCKTIKKAKRFNEELQSGTNKLCLQKINNKATSNIPQLLIGIITSFFSWYENITDLQRGDPEKFKYHMMKWENVCLPKDFGGLGITNTRLLNALILKWAWRLQNQMEIKMVFNQPGG